MFTLHAKFDGFHQEIDENIDKSVNKLEIHRAI